MSAKKDQIIELVENMTVLELVGLVKELETRFGVSAAAPMMAAMPVAAAAAPVVEEKTEFNVILTDSGANKINVIKEIRTITSLGLKEAKDLADNPPKPIKEGVSKAEAEDIKKKIEAAGGKVDVK